MTRSKKCPDCNRPMTREARAYNRALGRGNRCPYCTRQHTARTFPCMTAPATVTRAALATAA